MIPARNVSRLMLKQEVIDAVREGKFHIYAVNTIDEGLAVLTGLEAGELDEGGAYPEGTANYEIVGHLIAWAEKMENYGKDTEEEEKKDKEDEPGDPPRREPMRLRRTRSRNHKKEQAAELLRPVLLFV